jgi:hypothetical protein
VKIKIENRQQFLLAAAVAVSVLYAADLLVIEPLIRAWKARAQTVVTLRAQVTNGRRLIQREDGLRRRWSQMRTNTLPDNNSLAEQRVLKAFDNWSRESGAEVTGIMPLWKNDTDEYKTLACRVEASGDINTLSRFIYAIEKDPTGLKFESLELSTRDASGQQLTLDLQLSGLALVTQPSKP